MPDPLNLWIYTDADNTLWDTDAVFANAQLTLLQEVERLYGIVGPTEERLEFVRCYDQAIAARHHARLRYPPALLIRALATAVSGGAADDVASRIMLEGSAPTHDESVVLSNYGHALGTLPPMLPKVSEGLVFARNNGIPVYVVTEGPLELAQGRVRAHSIEHLVAGVLSAAKSIELYARLKQRAAPRIAVMIGDQSDRDISLAREAGMPAVLVAGRFRPAWTKNADIERANAAVQNYLEAIEWAAEFATEANG